MNEPLMFHGIALETVCPHCQGHGTGEDWNQRCPLCTGAGLILADAGHELLAFLKRYLVIDTLVRVGK